MTDWNDTESLNIRAFADYARKEKSERKANGDAKTNGAHHDNVIHLKSVPNFQAWNEREIAPRDWLLGNFISTTSRILITGPTGLGKTMLGIAIAFALEGGAQYLHWKAGRAARVLYVDGEMSLPWVRSLTKRKIGQAWFHHTGHNEGHSYGTKTREWQLDVCILMERVAEDERDLTFTLKFTKARGRRPENRADFENTTIGLRNNKWVVTQAGKKKDKVPESARIAFDLLRRAINEAGELPPVGDHVQAGVRGVRVSMWLKYCETGSICKSDSPDAFRMAFKRSAEKLQALGLMQVWADWVWIA